MGFKKLGHYLEIEQILEHYSFNLHEKSISIFVSIRSPSISEALGQMIEKPSKLCKGTVEAFFSSNLHESSPEHSPPSTN